MKTGLVALFVLVAQVGVAQTERAINGSETVIAIYHPDLRVQARDGVRLVIAAWPDGRVVWSEDQIDGGPPFRTGSVPPTRITDLLDKLERDGAFGDPLLTQPCTGHHARFTIMLLKKGRLKLQMTSRHEVTEREPGLFDTSCSPVALKQQTRFEALRGEPTTRLYYRAVWAEIRALVASLVPPDGKPTDGTVVVQRGDLLVWRDAAPAEAALR